MKICEGSHVVCNLKIKAISWSISSFPLNRLLNPVSQIFDYFLLASYNSKILFAFETMTSKICSFYLYDLPIRYVVSRILFSESTNFSSISLSPF